MCGRTTGRVWECRRHVGSKVGSKLQKKLIKNEKKAKGGRMEARRGESRVDGSSGGGGGRKTGRKRRGRYERRKAVFY